MNIPVPILSWFLGLFTLLGAAAVRLLFQVREGLGELKVQLAAEHVQNRADIEALKRHHERNAKELEVMRRHLRIPLERKL